jgi:hypothetical protein
MPWETSALWGCREGEGCIELAQVRFAFISTLNFPSSSLRLPNAATILSTSLVSLELLTIHPTLYLPRRLARFRFSLSILLPVRGLLAFGDSVAGSLSHISAIAYQVPPCFSLLSYWHLTDHPSPFPEPPFSLSCCAQTWHTNHLSLSEPQIQ